MVKLLSRKKKSFNLDGAYTLQRPSSPIVSDTRGIGTVRYPRIIAKDPDCAELLAKRTLTNLYNERPTWLDLAHRKLDEAVFAAYGWNPAMSDEEILAKLLELNLKQSLGQPGKMAGASEKA